MDVIERIALAKQSFEAKTCEVATQVFLPPPDMEELRQHIPDADFARVLGLEVYEFDGIPFIYCESGGYRVPTRRRPWLKEGARA